AIQHAMARHLRRMLELYPNVFPAHMPIRPSEAAVGRFLHARGLIVNGINRQHRYVRRVNDVLVPVEPEERNATGVTEESVYCVRVPTDGTREDETRGRLLAVLSPAFPTAPFL